MPRIDEYRSVKFENSTAWMRVALLGLETMSGFETNNLGLKVSCLVGEGLGLGHIQIVPVSSPI